MLDSWPDVFQLSVYQDAMRDMASAERAVPGLLHACPGRQACADSLSADAPRAHGAPRARHCAKTAAAFKQQPADDPVMLEASDPPPQRTRSPPPPSPPRLWRWGPGALVRLEGASSACGVICRLLLDGRSLPGAWRASAPCARGASEWRPSRSACLRRHADVKPGAASSPLPAWCTKMLTASAMWSAGVARWSVVQRALVAGASWGARQLCPRAPARARPRSAPAQPRDSAAGSGSMLLASAGLELPRWQLACSVYASVHAGRVCPARCHLHACTCRPVLHADALRAHSGTPWTVPLAVVRTWRVHDQ